MTHKKYSIVLLAMSLPLASLAKGDADEDLWNDDWQEQEVTSSSSWHGFVEFGYGNRTKTDRLYDQQHTLNEARIYLENSKDWDNFSVSFKGEAWYDGVLSETKGEIRELSLNFSAFGNTDVKIGRQISTWGTGDLLFVNDLFPKDWQGYFNGRDDVYVKAPANAIRVTSYYDALNLDLVWTPRFTPDNFINGERYSFFSPLAGMQVGGEDVINDIHPQHTLGNGELALRLYKNIEGTEYALYGYNGFDKRPLGFNQDFRPVYHKRSAVGFSIRGNALEGLYNIEAITETAKEDRSGSDPAVNNSLSKLLIGYETELFPKFNIAFQYYVEWIHDYKNLMNNSLSPEFETKKKRHWITNRITYQLMQDKLTFNLFSFYSPTDKDGFLRWNVNYRQDDNWNYIVGLNHIDGEKESTFFAQFERASNIYARVRYNF